MRWAEGELFSDNTSHLLEICQLGSLWLKIPLLLSLLPTHLPAPRAFTSRLSPCLVAPLYLRAASCLIYAQRRSQPATLLSNCIPQNDAWQDAQRAVPTIAFLHLKWAHCPSFWDHHLQRGHVKSFPRTWNHVCALDLQVKLLPGPSGVSVLLFCLHRNRRNVGTCPEQSVPVGPSDEWAAKKGAPSRKKAKLWKGLGNSRF